MTQKSLTTKQNADKIRDIIKSPSVEGEFSKVLKSHADSFTAGLIDLYNSDNRLQECDPKDVVMEALKAAILRLPINKGLGFAFLVPYKTKGVAKPQMQIGYKGYIQLAMRTGMYKILNTDMIYEGEYQSKNKITGEFDFSGEKISEKVEGYFAHLELIHGFTKTLYMTTEQIVAHAKKYSKSYTKEFSAWQTDFEKMALKTVLRLLLTHWGYLSVEMIDAISRDLDSDDVDDKEKYANKEPLSFDKYTDVTDEKKEGKLKVKQEVEKEIEQEEEKGQTKAGF